MSRVPNAPTSPSPRDRILAAAMTLLSEGGRETVSTRAVCDAADVQPPTIYRLFENKDGLLDAVAQQGFLLHQQAYAGLDETDDPLEDLRAGFDQHVAFGLANPYLYSVMFGRADPVGRSRAAADVANEVLTRRIRRVAEAGLLRVDEEFAALVLHAAGTGLTFTLIALPKHRRPPDASVRVREGVIGSIALDRAEMPGTGLVGAAAAVDVLLDSSDALLPVERALMYHWLQRLTRP